MNLTQLEQLLASELEQDVHKFYLATKNNSCKSFTTERQAWTNKLLHSQKHWQLLFQQHVKSKFSFWLSFFRNAYICVLHNLNVSFRLEYEDDIAQKLIDGILTTLNKLFKSSSFFEQLTKMHDQQNKNFENIEKRYADLSKINVDPQHLYFNLGIHTEFGIDFPIAILVKCLMSFEQSLKIESAIYASVAAYFYHLYYDPCSQCYGIHLYLTLNNHLRIEIFNYYNLISELWLKQTQMRGFVQNDQELLQQQWSVLSDCLFPDFTDTNSPLHYIDYLKDSYYLTGNQTTHLCVQSRGSLDIKMKVISV